MGLSPGAALFESIVMSPAQRDKRERLAKWLYMNFLAPDYPTQWDDLLQRQRNHWRKLADEALNLVTVKR